MGGGEAGAGKGIVSMTAACEWVWAWLGNDGVRVGVGMVGHRRRASGPRNSCGSHGNSGRTLLLPVELRGLPQKSWYQIERRSASSLITSGLSCTAGESSYTYSPSREGR